jgi:L-ascorbate metabolism protein UlaG (beta-lactamase superfamily)
MVITHHGGQCFKVSHGDTTIVFDPIGKESKLGAVKFGADVALVSLRHADFNGVEQVTFGNKAPFAITSPGEYEVGDVTVRGFGVPTKYDGADRYNTIYQVQMEKMNLVFLGALSEPDIDAKILGELGDIDILFVPIGGGDVLEVPQAAKLGVKLEAKCVIPMHFDKKALDAFLKESGEKASKPVDKLTVKQKDVATMSGEVVVLNA